MVDDPIKKSVIRVGITIKSANKKLSLLYQHWILFNLVGMNWFKCSLLLIH